MNLTNTELWTIAGSAAGVVSALVALYALWRARKDRRLRADVEMNDAERRGPILYFSDSVARLDGRKLMIMKAAYGDLSKYTEAADTIFTENLWHAEVRASRWLPEEQESTYAAVEISEQDRRALFARPRDQQGHFVPPVDLPPSHIIHHIVRIDCSRT